MSEIEAAPLTPAEPILKRLKRVTHSAHLSAEALVNILEPSVSLEDYRHYLERFLGFLEPLERELLAGPLREDGELDMLARQKCGLLERDLQALGGEPAALALLPRCTAFPDITDPASALGCLYVLEGSTLGGQFILRHVRPRLAALAPGAFAYLECYGGRTGEMWKTFGQVIGRGAVSEAASAQMVTAACETFAALGHWLGQGTTQASAPISPSKLHAAT